jgi:pilus assembly protein CpaF
MSPILDARMSDGSRACVVIPPIAVDGPTISIRKFSKRILPLASFGPAAATDIVKQLITTRANIVISGATSSGKTSLLSSASQFFSPHERIVCVEDTSELRFAHSHVVALQTRQPNQEGSGAISMQSLVRTSLRLRPDRLIVGEVRGAEVIDMLLALSSGHRGCWSTVHSSSASETISRLSALVLRDSPQWSSRQSLQIIHSAIDAVIHVERASSHRRRICDIIQLQPQAVAEHLYKVA